MITIPDGDNFQIITWPMVDVQNGTVSIESDGAFVYMPDEGFVGIDTFVYRICDDGFPSMCDEATVWINVLPAVDCDGLPGDEDEPITECSLFIPDGFSPNGDGVHDFFQIYCIEKYPDAVCGFSTGAETNYLKSSITVISIIGVLTKTPGGGVIPNTV
jgi:hypothetical protein